MTIKPNQISIILAHLVVSLVWPSAEAIVGGTNVSDLHEYPGFVWSGISPQDGWGCGGALIAQDVVLSAGHCLASFVGNPNNFIGPLFIRGRGAEFYATERILVHPGFSWASKVNDLLLVKLRGSSKAPLFKLNKDPNYPPANASVTVMGFGSTSEHGGQASFSPNLQQVDVDVYSFQDCKAVYDQQPGLGFVLNDTQHLCAGTVEGGRDGCESDSGCPLISGRNLIVGLTEDGIGCARPNVPAYYVRVSSHIDWIEAGVCALSSNPPKHLHCQKILPTLADKEAILNHTLTNAPTPSPTLPPTSSAPTTAPPSAKPTMSPTTNSTHTATLAPTTIRRVNMTHPTFAGNGSIIEGDRSWTMPNLTRSSETVRATYFLLVLVSLLVGFLLGRSVMQGVWHHLNERGRYDCILSHTQEQQPLIKKPDVIVYSE